MKKFIIICSFLFAYNSVIYSQTPSESLANRIAQKIADSISLTAEQKSQLYNINMQLHNQKKRARQQYAESDSVRIQIQRVENTRDSLYNAVLPDDKYLLYQEKKRTLISNN